jgi:thiamine biosynthesis protein ThiI
MMQMEKKVVSLLSGGLDSPIATYLMMKRGYDVLAISLITANDPEGLNRNKILQIASLLKEKTGRNIEVYFIKYVHIQSEFVEKAERKLTCLLCKRLMLRLAQRIAKEQGIKFIINGDILGEQASQTLENLYAVQRVVSDALVVRPLIGFDKLEVIRIAQQVGTYEICSMKSPGCDKNPQYPETHAKLKDLVKAESVFNYEPIVESLVKSAEIVKV